MPDHDEDRSPFCRRVLCLHMPDLPTDLVRRNLAPQPHVEPANQLGVETGPATNQSPLVLTQRSGASVFVDCVCSVSRQRGLRAGMTLGQAQAIAPDLIAQPRELRDERALLQQLAGRAQRFSPIVQPIEPGTLLLDISGCTRLFGSETNIAQQALRDVIELGFHARAAVADTVGAAFALASAGNRMITIVPEGQAGQWLALLPPIALRIGQKVADQLDELGVRSIDALMALPRDELPARFGAQTVRRLQQALGELDEPVIPTHPEEPAAARMSFQTPRDDLQTIQAAAVQLLEVLFAQLRERMQAIRRIDCTLVYERTAPHVMTVGLSRASRSWKHVTELVLRRLERANLSPGVCGVVVVAGETARWKPGQVELFEPRDPEGEEELGCLLDRLINRLGVDGVVRPQLVDDHQPERAFRYLRVADTELVQSMGKSRSHAARRKPIRNRVSRDAIESPGSDGGCSSQPRPTRLLPRPLPVRVTALVPDGPPTSVTIRSRPYDVAQSWGPERIETGWWRGPDVRRDYFRIATASGEHFWVFHDPASRQWYLHGLFV